MATMKGARLFDSGYSGAIASGNTNLVSFPLDVTESDAGVIQILTDGNASVNYVVQATIAPTVFVSRAGQKPLFGTTLTRDDTFASNMWSPLPNSSGTIALNAGVPQGTLIIVPSYISILRRIRVTLAYGGTGTSAMCLVLADSAVTGTA